VLVLLLVIDLPAFEHENEHEKAGDGLLDQL
jgi:hypothetical protein